ncbi:MAG: FkbM family methyltransferase [Holosporaceae bacterium]|jgi:FkbM family methyltransferase|nr:FkbM family methyltransferase [Holosporaceae bacterium]
MEYDVNQQQPEGGFFHRNKLVSFAIIIACLLFIIIFFLEKTKVLVKMIPKMRGEVSLGSSFSITTTKDGYPIVIKQNDPTVGSKVRFSGDIHSTFSETAVSMARADDIVVEIGAHFGYNTITIAKKLVSGKYYAFEPNATILSYLRKSLILNDLFEKVTLENFAISDRVELISIADCLSKTENSEGNYTKDRKIIVNSITLDKKLEGSQESISLLLIDIPEFVFPILNGAEKIIASSPSLRIVLYFDNYRASRHSNVENELKKLKNNGFIFYIVKEPNSYVESNIPDILSKNEIVLVMTKDKSYFMNPR